MPFPVIMSTTASINAIKLIPNRQLRSAITNTKNTTTASPIASSSIY